MSRLKLYLLGPPRLEVDDQPVEIKRRKALALLAYLAVTGRPQFRPTLANLLWGDMLETVALTNLRKILAILRKIVGPHLTITREDVTFNRDSSFWVDVEQFSAKAEDVSTNEGVIKKLQDAADLYEGEFLEGFYIHNTPEFEDWTLSQQTRLRALAAQTLQTLAHHHTKRGEAERATAISYTIRLLTLEPWREEAHRQMMLLLTLNGQRSVALVQYETCRRVLDEELGVEPSAETTRLYERIRQDELIGEEEILAALPHPSALQTKQDWGEAPDVSIFYGRQDEVAQLISWLVDDNCRLVGVLGMGGVGKTALVTYLAEQIKDNFEALIWRSLRNAPPLNEILADLILFLSEQQVYDLPSQIDKQLSLLLDYLRQKRCLLILDNVEAILQAGGQAGHYREGYTDYGQLLQRIGESRHQSCLVLTSREKPREFALLEGEATPVRTLQLANIDLEAGQAILQDRGLSGSNASWATLLDRYSGNPLALKLVAETVRELFFGEIQQFLQEEGIIFGGVWGLLAQQFDRLSELEQEILIWLAVEREPVESDQLQENIVSSVSRQKLLEALRNLHRRSLLEQTENGFTLQNVVMEFLTDYLVETISQEIINPNSDFLNLNRFALSKAQAKEYIRASQTRLILKPIAAHLLHHFGATDLERRLKKILPTLRKASQPGYAGGNLLNLLIHLNFKLQEYNFSELTVWQAYLSEQHVPDLNLAGADLTGAVFTDTFGEATSVAGL